MLSEIGYADALLVRELDDGSLELIDGHLRAELTPTAEVPVLILDLNEQEAAKLLALHDPLAAMADTNQEKLDELLAEVETRNETLRKELEQLGSSAPDLPIGNIANEVRVPEIYQVVVECLDEDEQRDVYERLKAEGRKCRLMNL